jgi:hypothetical protein
MCNCVIRIFAGVLVTLALVMIPTINTTRARAGFDSQAESSFFNLLTIQVSFFTSLGCAFLVYEVLSRIDRVITSTHGLVRPRHYTSTVSSCEMSAVRHQGDPAVTHIVLYRKSHLNQHIFAYILLSGPQASAAACG